ncbi:MAG TPA: GAF domain-containing sensor histidine kinase [Stenotrophomonas sp.]|jgi:signal transduction histidine kinase
MQARVNPGILADITAIGRIAAVPRILQTVAHITGLRFAAVARVTETSWTACATYDELGFGLVPGGELVLETTICNDIRHSLKPVIFEHASLHPVYSLHHTPRIYGLESYVSVPIVRPDGSFFGTLCAIDSVPAKFEEEHILRSMELFAEMIGNYLDSEERLQHSVSELASERDVGELRDQFIAVLGHDLRSPLQAVRLGTELLETEVSSQRGARLLGHIRKSLGRIDGLVDDVLDFARGRLGGGIPVALHADEELADELLQIVQEVKAASGRSDITADVLIEGWVICDRKRMAQLLANLLGNAATHGAADAPIALVVRGNPESFTMSVRNGGVIAADRLDKLFNPFSRSADEEPRPGLGLGLYIAAEIAKAHRGSLTVASNPTDGTTFTYTM